LRHSEPTCATPSLEILRGLLDSMCNLPKSHRQPPAPAGHVSADLPQKMNDVRLCQVIQGVEARLCAGPQDFRLVVLAEALKARFGADSTPDSWLRSYWDNAAEIQRVACEQFRASGDPLVIIRHFDA